MGTPRIMQFALRYSFQGVKPRNSKRGGAICPFFIGLGVRIVSRGMEPYGSCESLIWS